MGALHLHTGPLQPDLPGGGTGNDALLQGGEHCADPIQRAGFRTAFPQTRQTSERLEKDAYAKFKYDATAQQDGIIIERVAELAEKRGVTMTEISLAWLLTKVTSPVVGATKFHHVDGAVKATELVLTEEETAYLEAPYVPHPLAGVMAQNKPVNAGEKRV